MEVPLIMRAFDPEVGDAVWHALEPLVPVPVDDHPLGCHRPRIPDRVCFQGILIRLVTGCAWVDVETLLGGQVSDTTLRARRDGWIAAGVFDALIAEALAAYDRIIELDLTEVSLDGSQHTAPCGGEGTGPNPTDRGRSGWKWSIVAGADGIPFGWALDGANRHDMRLLEPTLAAAAQRGLLTDIETLHLDRGYDNGVTRTLCDRLGLDDLVCARKRSRGVTKLKKKLVPLGMRWPIERTNSWLSNFGQLRRNTDRRTQHRHAQLSLAVTLLITAKLIDWRDRWSPE
ncbi:MAG: IS5 family transposase [Acidimicrobiales bacterium]|nr:IS5 family transposase [Acidimicrobiales bacterium]